jgi:hypothetical protein
VDYFMGGLKDPQGRAPESRFDIKPSSVRVFASLVEVNDNGGTHVHGAVDTSGFRAGPSCPSGLRQSW